MYQSWNRTTTSKWIVEIRLLQYFRKVFDDISKEFYRILENREEFSIKLVNF